MLLSTDYSMYLDVTLDRTLTFQEHCFKIKMKVQAMKKLLRKLQRQITLTVSWLYKWRLELNSNNTKAIIFGTKSHKKTPETPNKHITW